MGEEELQLLSQAVAAGVVILEQSAKQLRQLSGKDSGAALADPCHREYEHGC